MTEGRKVSGLRTITTDCFGIVVEINDKGGATITSEMHDWEEPAHDANIYNAAIDGVEAMILAHAAAGVDIMDPKYLEGIETAVQQIAAKL